MSSQNIVIVLYIIFIIFLLVISSFFSASETGLTASSKGKIHNLRKNGNKKAKIVEKLLSNKDSLMSTILLGNNVVNILSSAIATSIFIKFFGERGVIYATFIMTLLVLIFAEIAPKTYALKNSEKVALESAPILSFLVKIFYPITKRIQIATNFIIKLFDSNKLTVSSHIDEIRGTIDLKYKEGFVFKSNKDMIENILDLDQIEVEDISIYRNNIKSINYDQDIDIIIEEAIKINHNKIPLWKGNKENIISILDTKKLIKFHNTKITKNSLDSITSKPWFIPASNSLSHQLLEFKRTNQEFAIIINEYGGIEGIITLKDILEEIILGIRNAAKRANIVKKRDGSYKILGTTLVRDINKIIGHKLTDDDAVTLAGFIIDKIEKIPEEGEKFNIGNFKYTILKKRKNRIILLHVEHLFDHSNCQIDSEV